MRRQYIERPGPLGLVLGILDTASLALPTGAHGLGGGVSPAMTGLSGLSGLLRRRRPGGVLVYGVAGCAFWGDANQEAYANDAVVPTIHDWSGGGHDLTTSGSPVFKTNVVNGKPVFRLDGVDDFASEAVVSLAQPFTIILVAKESAGQTGRLLFNSNNNNNVQVFAISATQWQCEPGANPSVAGNTGAFGVLSFVANGASAVVAFNGTTAAANSLSAGGVGARIGATSTGTGPFNGDVPEVLVFPGSALGSTDRHSIEVQLGTKYAITIS